MENRSAIAVRGFASQLTSHLPDGELATGDTCLQLSKSLCTRQKSELTKTVLQNLESKPSLQVVMNSISSPPYRYLKWNKSHLDVLSILIVAIIKRRTVNWTELATTFPGTAQTSSCYRRIQHFSKALHLMKKRLHSLLPAVFTRRCLDAQHGSYQLDVWSI